MIDVTEFMVRFTGRNPGETEFQQAVQEVAEHVIPYINEHPAMEQAKILERITEPDRMIVFRVCWEDDSGEIQVNRGYRVQFNNTIGPYKGGLRFEPSVNLSVLKFLGFEQTFKNSLTTLPMGSGKGGADFDPRGRSDGEVMRFCQSFMTELFRHIGEDTDVPAGDIGVGAREIGYLFGQYKRLSNRSVGTMTGKGLEFGGSPIRTEATGYGCVYFAAEMLNRVGDDLEDKVCVVSGSGNVAQYCAQKLIECGANVVSMSDRGGFIHDSRGLDEKQIEYLIDLKTRRHGSLQDFAEEFACDYYAGKRPWDIPCDIAFPCATQNEIDEHDAALLLKNGCMLVCEGANMPTTAEGARLFRDAGILYGPAKAANAGGVAISGLEMTQNAIHYTLTREELDQELHRIMCAIHSSCVSYGSSGKGVDYVKGANLAGFVKVAKGMLAYGVL
jgi:glutamate dehydrogenase (NADP+)